MRNLFLSLSIVMLFNFANVKWTVDSSKSLFTTLTLRVGEYVSGYNPFRLWFDNFGNHFWFTFNNKTNKCIFNISD